MGAFPQSYLSTVGVIMDIHAPEHDIPWSYHAHSVNLTVWSRMDYYGQTSVFPILNIWNPLPSHYSILCTCIDLHKLGLSWHTIAIWCRPYILFSSPVSYCHRWCVRPSSVVVRPSSVRPSVRRPSLDNFFPRPDLRPESMDLFNIWHSYDMW